ncbi:MAG: serine hydrolase [Ardenticatenaceae bacterium]|nr:serine hydrolase [Ardenticatenaceae bacterium]
MRPRRSNPILKTIWSFIRSLLLLGVVTAGLWWLGNEGWSYWQTRSMFPNGTTIAGLDVSQTTPEEAARLIGDQYAQPIMARYQDEVVEINPGDIGFTIEPDLLVKAAATQMNEVPHYERFGAYLIGRPVMSKAINVPLTATHDDDALNYIVGVMGDMLDQPATLPVLLTNDGEIKEGQDGYRLDSEQAKTALQNAFYDPHDRVATLDIVMEEAPEIDFSFLDQYLNQLLEPYAGIGALYILDLQTGEEIKINADVAVSGLSIVKIAIMLETMRAVDGPLTFDQQKLLEETAIYSGNYSANLLLDVVAGQDNAYLGSDILTQSMTNLGLENTFIVTPYDEPQRPGRFTQQTAANSRVDINLDPDPAMQTTAEEIGQLLGMIYYCAQGGGTLIAVYGDQITPEECQLLINTLARNDEGNLIRFGVPEGVTVAHKHGWAYNTHGDAGIVLSPGGDYVIVEYLYGNTDWLPVSLTFPLLREMSRTVYNYYNPDEPYVDHKRAQRVAGRNAAQVAAQAAEGALTNEP